MLNASCVSQLYFENNFPKSLLVNLSGCLILLEGIFYETYKLVLNKELFINSNFSTLKVSRQLFCSI